MARNLPEALLATFFSCITIGFFAPGAAAKWSLTLSVSAARQ
jgi:hypothetical protein